MTDQAPRTRRRHGRRMRLLRRLVSVLVLTVLGSLGGVAMTSLWPVQLQTDNFSAEARILPSPLRTSIVHMPTVLGDIDIDFDGPVPAPGIEARVQVRQEITDLFSGGPVDVDRLTPDQGQLRAAMGQGLRELGWKFVGGVLVTDLFVVSLWLLGRARQPVGSSVRSVVAATLIATLVPGVASLLTYRTANVGELRTTSLISTVQENTGLFTDISDRAQQATPYVQNLLALSDALHQEFVPAQSRQVPGARLLLVSDIHGMNYYPLLRQLVQDQGITAVVDSGDLVNFGRPEEGEISGIYAGIESLGVPYLFVRGNHDALAQGDDAVLRRLDQVPNVVLLEPAQGQYLEASVNGVRVSGFNDWRRYGEADRDFGALAREAAAAYAAGTAGNSLPDVLVTHEPFGLDQLQTGGVKVNGHMHVAALEDERIQVGTFTGGGLVNHFQVPEDEDPDTRGELVGAPYSFDILDFGTDCSVQTLTRYTYRNLVSGRPQFDTVSVVSGSRFAIPLPEDAGRSCGPEQGFSSRMLLPVDPQSPADQQDQDSSTG